MISTFEPLGRDGTIYYFLSETLILSEQSEYCDLLYSLKMFVRLQSIAVSVKLYLKRSGRLELEVCIAAGVSDVRNKSGWDATVGCLLDWGSDHSFLPPFHMVWRLGWRGIEWGRKWAKEKTPDSSFFLVVLDGSAGCIFVIFLNGSDIFYHERRICIRVAVLIAIFTFGVSSELYKRTFVVMVSVWMGMI